MTQHNHKHPRSHDHTQNDEEDSWKFHKDWRVWLVVGMMLAAMCIYVLTLDESVVPAIMRQ
ncbi:hypothetical protein [Desulfomonile tiedjei]|uniref:Uncharacterized protein n=1 Tax=Desulfomonile tiedjei (strain ATCC 49306 / DSM 6799 / DCB-1) TaxID=706587 RepID=I4C4N5_DESTA|nr:hypothetical protein [Desulfomonile tiedjei]AFM24526.1 hypothetical protein Desti_1818 [Desulfomonile tiedjei DSM 6799]